MPSRLPAGNPRILPEESGRMSTEQKNSFLNLTAVLAVAVLIVVVISVWMKQPTMNGGGPGGLAVGKPAPEIRAAGWINGTPPSQAERAGKVTVVNAWFADCPACLARAPEIVGPYERFRNRGVIFIGLTFDEEADLPAIRQKIAHMKMKWPNGYGALETLQAFDAMYFPSVWVIDGSGTVVWNTDSPESLDEGIERALAAAPK